jgi:uncharacterized membrane protein YgcG
MIYAYDFISCFAPAEGKQYLKDVIWAIYDRLATFTQMGAYSLSSARAAIADAHFNQALACLNVLPDSESKAYTGRKAYKFFKDYGFVARESEEEDEEAAATTSNHRSRGSSSSRSGGGGCSGGDGHQTSLQS